MGEWLDTGIVVDSAGWVVAKTSGSGQARLTAPNAGSVSIHVRASSAMPCTIAEVYLARHQPHPILNLMACVQDSTMVQYVYGVRLCFRAL
jgi:hypothetical protein